MNYAPDGSVRLDTVEDRISELEDVPTESQKNRSKKNKDRNTEQTSRGLRAKNNTKGIT